MSVDIDSELVVLSRRLNSGVSTFNDRGVDQYLTWPVCSAMMNIIAWSNLIQGIIWTRPGELNRGDQHPSRSLTRQNLRDQPRNCRVLPSDERQRRISPRHVRYHLSRVCMIAFCQGSCFLPAAAWLFLQPSCHAIPHIILDFDTVLSAKGLTTFWTSLGMQSLF